MLLKKNYNYLFKYSILFLIIIGSLLRFYGLNTQGYWFDEWTTLWHSNPNFKWEDFYTLRREFAPGGEEYEGTPKLYFYILRNFFILFGYTAENGRIFTAIASILSLINIYYLSKILTHNKKTILLIIFLTSFNLFLIWEAQETRVQSVVLFFSVLNIFLFLKLLKKQSLLKILSFSISVILVLSISPVTFTIIFSQIFFIILNFSNYKKIIFKFFLIYLISGAFYLFFNIEYLLNIIQFTGYVHAKLNWHFFVGYFFNVFFGSTIFGGFILALLCFLVIKNYKYLLKHQNIQFLFFVIFFAYFFLLIYSFRNGMMAPRYIIFLVPIIIIFTSLLLERDNLLNKNNFNYFLIFLFTITNLLLKLDDRPIKKPPTQKIIKIIINSKIKNVATTINSNRLFANYLVTHNDFKKNNLIFFDIKKDLNIPNKIWLICHNNLRADFGINHNLKSPDCKSQILEKNMKLSKSIKEIDLQLSLYEK